MSWFLIWIIPAVLTYAPVLTVERVICHQKLFKYANWFHMKSNFLRIQTYYYMLAVHLYSVRQYFANSIKKRHSTVSSLACERYFTPYTDKNTLFTRNLSEIIQCYERTRKAKSKHNVEIGIWMGVHCARE